MHAVGSMSVGAPHVAGGTVCASSAPKGGAPPEGERRADRAGESESGPAALRAKAGDQQQRSPPRALVLSSPKSNTPKKHKGIIFYSERLESLASTPFAR